MNVNLPEGVRVKHFYEWSPKEGKLKKYEAYTKLIDETAGMVVVAKAKCNLDMDVPKRKEGKEISLGRAIKAWQIIRAAMIGQDISIPPENYRMVLSPSLYPHVKVEKLEYE